MTNLTGNQERAILGSGVRGGRLYFVADSKKGQELWVSDGTRRGTRALTNFAKRDAFAAAPENFFPLQREGLVNGRLLFWVDDGSHGAEPWVTDGTRQGTRLLRDLCPGACSSFVDPWYVLKGRLYFNELRNGGELWSTDGTPRGTRRVCRQGCGSRFHTPVVAGGRLFFVSWDSQHGEEVWSTDGTAAGPVRVTDFEPPFIWEEDGFHAAALDGKLLFGAPDPAHGMELWVIEP